MLGEQWWQQKWWWHQEGGEAVQWRLQEEIWMDERSLKGWTHWWWWQQMDPLQRMQEEQEAQGQMVEDNQQQGSQHKWTQPWKCFHTQEKGTSPNRVQQSHPSGHFECHIQNHEKNLDSKNNLTVIMLRNIITKSCNELTSTFKVVWHDLHLANRSEVYTQFLRRFNIFFSYYRKFFEVNWVPTWPQFS